MDADCFSQFRQDLFIDRRQEDAADARLRRSSRCSDDVTELSRQLSTIGGFIHCPTVEHPKPQKEETAFGRFKRLTTKVILVPHAEIQKRETQWKNGRKQHKSHPWHR
jgi:hypothetical protein